jgi:hypothetical protein
MLPSLVCDVVDLMSCSGGIKSRSLITNLQVDVNLLTNASLSVFLCSLTGWRRSPRRIA